MTLTQRQAEGAAAPAFVHLRVHSEYSVVDGLAPPKALVQEAARLGMPALALTDQSNLYALIKFHSAALAAGVKPICGADLWLAHADNPGEPPSRLSLLVMNQRGYRNLTKLIARAHLEGQGWVPEKALVRRDWVVAHAEGLIALSGGREGEVGQALLAGRSNLAREYLHGWMDCFAGRFYLELQRTGRPGDEDSLHATLELAEALQCPVVATNDVRFIAADDFYAHEARICINQSRVLEDPRRPREYSEQQYFRSAEEMAELFADIPSALENSLAVARRCNLELEQGKYYLPNYPIPSGMTMDDYFAKVSREGLQERLERFLDTEAPDYRQECQRYRERLEFELGIIIDMGFAGYFLIVMDFIQWAKDQGVPVGPGRGSGAGSLVAYSLKITDLDPLKYDLLFERFLNPERVSMPDFDIDFCMDNRDRVIDYVAETYGRDAVSQIITFGTMAAKAVVRDVARVQGKPYGLADRLSKMIPFEVGMTLEKALAQEETLSEFLDNNEDAREIWEMALRLEGVTRGVGKHAGGVVIAPTRLTDFAPLYCDENGDSLVTQFDKNDVETAGLVKFDFLGLRTLTIINGALETIHRRQREQGEALLDLNDIDLEEPRVYEMLKRGDTTAVFQLESTGMKELMKRLQPSRFEDIIALVALFRPGPLQSGMVDDFINRKHGRAPLAYPHPQYEYKPLRPVLEPTYGVVLYQEQVMQIAQVMAGYTLGGADMLRRAMGKKKAEEMAKQRAIFLKGCEDRGLDADLAGNIFDLVEKFAGYGFNKSHSAAYALVSYQTAWLKEHYPAAFMASVMSADMQNTDKVVIFIEECRRLGLVVTLPDVNSGAYPFTVDERDQVVYGLGAVKGVGEGPIAAIVSARQEGGSFADLFDFCRRVGTGNLNKRTLEALVRCGALDALGPSRGVLWAAIADALKAADQNARNEDAGMLDLFGDVALADGDQSDPYEPYRHLQEWSGRERLRGEKETLGLYVTGHPVEEYRSELAHLVPRRLAEVQPERRTRQKLAGLVLDVRQRKTRRGDTLAIVVLDDRSARLEVSLFGEDFERFRELLQPDQVLLVEAEVVEDDYSGQLKARASRVLDMPGARREYGHHLCLSLSAAAQGSRLVTELEESLLGHCQENGLGVRIDYEGEGVRASLDLGDTWRVAASDELLWDLRRRYGPEALALVY